MPKASMELILKKAVKKVVPKTAERERLEKLAARALELANKEALKHDAYAIIAGSLTRDTWLPGKMEFDLFILFKPSLTRDKLEKFGLQIGKDVIRKLGGRATTEYAEHPYTGGCVRGLNIDVVPCYELESTEQLKSSVDRTPFHVRYIEKKLPAEMSNDVRLLKQFCTAASVYGADAKTEGFSGYVCELLTIRYGKFAGILKAVAGWRAGEIIDIENFYRKEEYREFAKAFKNQPLIIVDPTDRTRNTAAAVSPASFCKLRSVARRFLEKPTLEAFFPKPKKPLSANELKTVVQERETSVIVVSFKPPAVVPDILWPQMRRLGQRLESILGENDFDVLRRDVYTNGYRLAAVIIEMENCRLPAVRKRIGPSVFDETGARNFAKTYKRSAINGPFVEAGFWVVETKRRFRTAQEKLGDSLGDSLKVLEAKGVPSHVARQISRGFQVTADVEKIAKLAKNDKGFGVFLRDYFDKENLS
ncbi:MAG: CCA tRNA nucleotidyltransferase [Candidatus Aenigmatarchaeota archaeon]